MTTTFEAATHVAGLIVGSLIICWLSWMLGRGRPETRTNSGGVISPDKVSAVIVVAIGLAVIAGGGALVVYQDNLAAALGAFLIGAVLVGSMAPSLGHAHDVAWSDIGLEGPCKTFWLTLGWERTLIPWSKIRKTGRNATGYWFAEADDGRRVYWSYLYRGHGLLAAALKERCSLVVGPPPV